jgi:hypothetical protein
MGLESTEILCLGKEKSRWPDQDTLWGYAAK